MSNDILVISEHLDGKIADISYEMIGLANKIAASLGGQSIAVVLGSGMLEQAGTFNSGATLYVDDPALAHFNPEAYGKVIEALVADRTPSLILFGSTSMGMDIAAWLSVRSGKPCLAYANKLSIENGQVVVTSKVYAGKIMAEAIPDGDGDGAGYSAIVLMLAGSYPAEDGKGKTLPQPITPPISLEDLRTRFVKWITPDAGDIDITTQEKLVAVGRGIGSREDIGLVEELAEALGAAVAASRPIADAGWLPKTRQVGKSGVVVKPKLYLTLGISGAPEHIEGMKDAGLIIAVNTDPKAPIFDVAHFGTTLDLFDVTEAMLEELG